MTVSMCPWLARCLIIRARKVMFRSQSRGARDEEWKLPNRQRSLANPCPAGDRLNRNAAQMLTLSSL
jgi:hypothetical protein